MNDLSDEAYTYYRTSGESGNLYFVVYNANNTVKAATVLIGGDSLTDEKMSQIQNAIALAMLNGDKVSSQLVTANLKKNKNASWGTTSFGISDSPIGRVLDEAGLSSQSEGYMLTATAESFSPKTDFDYFYEKTWDIILQSQTDSLEALRGSAFLRCNRLLRRTVEIVPKSFIKAFK